MREKGPGLLKISNVFFFFVVAPCGTFGEITPLHPFSSAQ